MSQRKFSIACESFEKFYLHEASPCEKIFNVIVFYVNIVNINAVLFHSFSLQVIL